ncbi:phage holin family protein [Pedobacter fastidiosus]|uniref:Phage holin family protein n=1 Tax=Pedobacter fastidiosus TaxID=2765361 RepID=A0ABR7KSW6_9SPHI|nr:phage holin family protein [Pedobacter fastidiosus]MBC6111180.1 phage holin family protein [Pedobacter fastidiosus]
MWHDLLNLISKAIPYAYKFGFFVYLYFSPTHSSLLVITIFVIIDFITGVWKARRNKQDVTSKMMRVSIGKAVAYMIAILIAHLFELTFASALPFMRMVAFFIASAEIKSIYENLGEITGLDFWTFIKEKLAGINSNKNSN